MSIKEYLENINDIPNKIWINRKYLAIICLIIIFALISFPVRTVVEKNITYYHSVIDLGFADYGFSSAIIVGLLGFLTTIYTNDKNLKETKISLMPKETLELKSRLEYLYIFYHMHVKLNQVDEIVMMIEFMGIWTDYITIFNFLFSDSHDEIMKMIENAFGITNKETSHEVNNANTIMSEILIAIINSKNNKSNEFKYKNLEKCTCGCDINKIAEEKTIKMTKDNFIKYIKTIECDETRELTLKKFNEFIIESQNFFKNLEKNLSKLHL